MHSITSADSRIAAAARFPLGTGRPGEMLEADARMRAMTDPVTGLVPIPARALRFCDSVDGRFPRGMCTDGAGKWVSWSDGSSEVLDPDSMITVKPGSGKF